MTAGGDITYTKAVLYGQDISHLTREQLESLTSIGNPLVTVPLGISDKNDNGNGTTVILEATFQNSNLKADLPYTAVGFFAKRGDDAEKLIAVGVATDGAYLAATSPDGVATDALDIKVAIAIGDSANVTAMIDPAGSVTPAALHNAITDVKSEMKTGLDTKADKSTVDSDVKSINDTLATKADKQTVTDDLVKKADKADVDAQIGTVNKSVSDLSDTVKANKDDTDKVLATKADKATVESELSTKANQSDLDKTNAEVAKKASTTDVNSQLATKADAKDVTDALALKDDTVDVDKKISNVQSSISALSSTVTSNKSATDTVLDTKADKTTVNQELATKANSTDVDDKLAAKADSADVTKQIKTITDLANTKADQTALDATNATVATKANSTDVDSEIAGVTKSITDVSNTVKANKDDADKALATKADKTTVEQELAVKANSSDVDKKLDKKADKSSVDAKINAIDFSKIKFRKQYLTQNGTSSDKTWNATKNSDGSYTIDIYQDDWTAYKVASLLQAITTKADQSSLDATNKTVATKANSSDVYTKKQVDDAFSSRDATIATKADKATVDAEISKIDFTPYAKTVDVNKEIKTVTDLANTKVDATYSYSKAELDKKLLALSTDTSGKVNASQVASMIAGKADKTDVDKKIATVNKSISDLSDTVSANKTATDASLATKANASDVADNVKTLQANIDTKADKATVDAEIAKIDFTPYAKSADVDSKLKGYTNTADLTKLLTGKRDIADSYSRDELDKKFLQLSTDTSGKVSADQIAKLLASKVDKTDLTSQLQAITDSIGTKANSANVTAELAKKDNTADVDAKIKTVTDLANTKANSVDVTAALDKKDDTSDVDAKIKVVTDTVNSQVEDAKNTAQSKLDQAKSDLTSLIDNIKNFNVDSYKGRIPSTDMNKITDAGLYGFSNVILTNSPYTGNRWGLLLVIREFDNDPNNIDQFITSNGSLFWRNISLTNNLYRNWKRFADDGDVAGLKDQINTKANASDLSALDSKAIKSIGIYPNDLNFTNGKFTNWSSEMKASPNDNGYALIDLSDDMDARAAADQLNTMLTNLNNLQGKQTKNKADANDLSATGVYYVYNPSKNFPVVQWGTLVTNNANGQRSSQFYFPDDNSCIWFRTYNAGWKDWVNLANGRDITTLHDQIDAKVNTTVPLFRRITAGATWNDILGTNNGSGVLVSIRDEGGTNTLGNFSAAIAFGGADTKGVLNVAYSGHTARIIGGNGNAPVWHEDIAWKSDVTNLQNQVNTKASASDVNSLNQTISALQQTVQSLQNTVNQQATQITGLQTLVNNQAQDIAYIKANYIEGKRSAKADESQATAWEKENSQRIAFIEDKQKKGESMTLEKMKYQLRDWFAGTENYIGKAIHMPDGVGLTPYWLASDLNSIIVEDGQGNNPVVPNSKIIGLYNVSNTEKFVIARWTNTDNADVSAMFLVDEIFKNGGYRVAL